MFATLTRGGYSLPLAGGDGVSSETSNFSISNSSNFQQASYIEANEGVQFFRGGTMQNVSFQCVINFATVALAEIYVLTTPQGLLNQAGQTVQIGRKNSGGTVTHSITLTNASVILQLAHTGTMVTQQVTITGRYA